MSKTTSPYLMEDVREAARLAEKVDAPEWVRTYFDAYLSGASRILDVGCGPAKLLTEVALRNPNAYCVGVDASETRLTVARRAVAALPNASVQLADACALPFPDGSFDFVCCRFLLEYLPRKDQAVAEMARVCRPGGYVLLQDLDGQLVWHYPVDKQLQAGIDQTMAELAKTGFDPFTGRKLFSLMRSANLEDVKVRVDPYHLYAGQIGEHDLRLWKMKLDIALPAIANALGGELPARQLITRLLDFLKGEETLTYSMNFTVSGRRHD